MTNATVSGDENGQKEEPVANELEDGISGPLIYPEDINTYYDSKIRFSLFEIDTPQVRGESSTADSMKALSKPKSDSEEDNLGFFGRLLDFFDFTPDIPKSSKNNENTGSSEEGKENEHKSRIKSKEIEIYLPIGFSSTDTLNYESPQLGAIGAAGSAAIASGANVGSTALNGIFEGGKDFLSGIKGNALSSPAAALAAAKAANKLPGGTGGMAASAALKVTADPNVRTLFKGVGVRSFQFSFKFLAKSQNESKTVENIIKRFRYYSYPDNILVGGISAGFKFPNSFRIEILSKGIDGQLVTVGHRILSSYLTNITTNYNPSSMTFHSDGRPVEIDLSLTFTEETTLNRTKIKEGF